MKFTIANETETSIKVASRITVKIMIIIIIIIGKIKHRYRVILFNRYFALNYYRFVDY